MYVTGMTSQLFRCASISWIHVEESVSQWLIHVFEILSNITHIFRLCSECVQSVFWVCSECVQSVFNIEVISSPSASSVLIFGNFSIIWWFRPYKPYIFLKYVIKVDHLDHLYHLYHPDHLDHMYVPPVPPGPPWPPRLPYHPWPP